MPLVAIYQYKARFQLKPEFRKTPDQERVLYEGLLLLRQDTPERTDDAAIEMLSTRYETTEAVIEGFGVMDPRTLDHPDVVQYAPLHREALETGSALSYVDPSAYAQVPDSKPADGFRPALPR